MGLAKALSPARVQTRGPRRIRARLRNPATADVRIHFIANFLHRHLCADIVGTCTERLHVFVAA